MRDEISDISEDTRIALARAIDLVIERAGSVWALAEVLGLTPGAVSHWHKIPLKYVMQLEAMTGIRREVLRPDVYYSQNHFHCDKLMVPRSRRVNKTREERALRRAVL